MILHIIGRTDLFVLLFGVMLLVGTASITLYVPPLIGRLMDESIASIGEDTTRSLSATYYLSVLFCLQFCLTFGQSVCLAVFGERFARRMRIQLYHAVLDKKREFLEHIEIGDIVSRITSDVDTLRASVVSKLGLGLYGVIFVIGATGILYRMSPLLTLQTLSVYPVITILSVYLGETITEMQTRMQSSLGEIASICYGRISAFTTVKQFRAEQREKQLYDSKIQETYRIGMRLSFAKAILEGIAELAGNLSLIVVFALGGQQVREGRLTGGELLSFTIYAMNLSYYFDYTASYMVDYLRSIGVATRVVQILEGESEAESGIIPRKIYGRVCFKEVSFCYPSRPNRKVLDKFNVEISSGESVALVGESGVGKSTLSHLLTRLYECEEGSIELDGVNICELDIGWLREQIGIVSQQPMLLAISIAENIRYGNPWASNADIRRVAEKCQCHGFISALPNGYDTVLDGVSAKLSGGQKQRIAIARMMLKNPRIIILDEATSALDSENKRDVLKSLQELIRGKTTLVISHQKDEMGLAERVVELKDGRIKEE